MFRNRSKSESDGHKKLLRWRFGSKEQRRQENRQPPTTPTRVTAESVRPSSTPSSNSQHNRNRRRSEGPLTPTSNGQNDIRVLPALGQPMSPDEYRRVSQESEKRASAMKALMRDLSLKDDPSKFGKATIAARKMQREELDAAMARNLFMKELASGYQFQPVSPNPQNGAEQQNLPPGFFATPVRPVDPRQLEHLRPAFTEEQWQNFQKDPLKYISKNGLPEDPNARNIPEIAEEPSQPPLEDFSILPDHLPLDSSLIQQSPIEVQPPPPKKGFEIEEINSILTTFTYRTQRETKEKPKRVKGRRLPKGSKPQGVISDEEATECSICLIDFERGDKVGLLPCCHRFHADCVIDWLQRDATCPECREELKQYVS